jgi:Sulfatase-modifying factor enzyme 1
VYIVNPGFENKPVVYVSFWDAVRFANWLHNGRPFGVEDATTTEDGAYTLTADDIANNRVNRDPAATSFLPRENEWYKAAYYDPALPGYYDYPAGTDTPTTCAMPGAASNSANCEDVADALTDVGSYTDSASPYGTFDQGGNVFEWNEQIVVATARGIRGGSWLGDSLSLGAFSAISAGPTLEQENLGFRVARPLPEPAQALLVLTGGFLLAVARRRRHAKAL